MGTDPQESPLEDRILKLFREKYGVAIGERTAESISFVVSGKADPRGQVTKSGESLRIEEEGEVKDDLYGVKGMLLATGLPARIAFDPEEVRRLLESGE